jgi:hypothetical protein
MRPMSIATEVKDLTGNIVKFTSDLNNQFERNELAVCLDGINKKFLGIHGPNFGKVYYESGEFDVLGNDSHVITNLLSGARDKYSLPEFTEVREDESEYVGLIIDDVFCNGYFGHREDLEDSKIIASGEDWITIRTVEGKVLTAQFGDTSRNLPEMSEYIKLWTRDEA